ncbi:glutamate-1-semialdehyde 2,1-aminomutase [Actinosynnema sp. CS-041913]|uniref:glutamate-1-semialdehyde 2,1-aminomutase n=1 Tax=Actinosynnema sp. CS-041913 TaxID=3239917 RepID=UPI003D8C0659
MIDGVVEAVAGDRRARLLERAEAVLPGGVNSPVRSFRAVGGRPLVIAGGSGARVTDVNGKSYVDYVLSYGPLVLGHAHPEVVDAISATARNGTGFGATTELEIELAELVRELVPSVEMLRMTNSGTEATMSAIRLARGFTGRDVVVKFEGNYHGHGDVLLVSAGSGAATQGQPDSAGVPRGAVADTVVLPYNDLDAVREYFSGHGGNVAAVIVEPVAGNMGCVPPAAGFLPGLRELTTRHGALLVFDEVMTGFRVAPGGAQQLYAVTPDLSCFGKVIGGGLPVGAFGGRRDVMELLAPLGPVYQAGTLSGNPVAMAAGLATVRTALRTGCHRRLEELGRRWETGMRQATADAPVSVHRVGSMLGLFFTESPPTDFASASGTDTDAFRRFFRHLLARGIHLAPSPFEAGFLSGAHTPADVDRTCEIAADWLTREYR